jgi:hypothetical protein
MCTAEKKLIINTPIKTKDVLIKKNIVMEFLIRILSIETDF